MPKYCILLSEDSLLLIQKNGQWQLPQSNEIEANSYHLHYSFEGPDGTEYHVGENKQADSAHQKLMDLHQAYSHLGKPLFQLIGRARQLLDWRINHQFCGRCASPTEFFDQDRAKKCSHCGLTNYPKISPCILVSITRGDEVLLAHPQKSRQDLYTILAGFVEPGETIEACVHREVMEEVGLKIKNLHYVASQPWPFPNLVMLGFTAEYESGEINIDENEIADAQWFHRDKLPETLPSPISLSFTLLQDFIFRKKPLKTDTSSQV